MREFVCEVCGTKGIDRSPRQDRRYCSRDCLEKGRYHKKKTNEVCPYNDGLQCEDKDCGTCGWNPAVQKVRNKQIQERMQKTGYAKIML